MLHLYYVNVFSQYITFQENYFKILINSCYQVVTKRILAIEIIANICMSSVVVTFYLTAGTYLCLTKQ